MHIDITTQIQIAYLIGLRAAELTCRDTVQNRTRRTIKKWYVLKKDDPIPEGLRVGNILYAEFDKNPYDAEFDKSNQLDEVSWGS